MIPRELQDYKQWVCWTRVGPWTLFINTNALCLSRLIAHSGLKQQRNDIRLRGLLHVCVESGERELPVARELQIGSVVDCEPGIPRRREQHVPRRGCAGRLDLNGQRSQSFGKFNYISKTDFADDALPQPIRSLPRSASVPAR